MDSFRATICKYQKSVPANKKYTKAGDFMKKTICFIIAAIILLGMLAGCVAQDNNNKDKDKDEDEEDLLVLYESENFEINSAMASYMYMNIYQQYYSMYGEYASYFMPSDVTTLIGAKTILARCEAARALGYNLTNEDLAEIDADINELKATLAS